MDNFSKQASKAWRGISGFGGLLPASGPVAPVEPPVNTPIDDAYDDWKAADAAARVLEKQVGEAWYRHDFMLGPPPSRELLREAACLRHEASDRLARLIQLLHDSGRIQPAVSAPQPSAAAATATAPGSAPPPRPCSTGT